MGGGGYGGGGRGRLYTYCYTVTTRMTPALRWAAMRAILFFSMKKWTKSQDSVHKPQPFRRERRAEAVSNRGPSAYQPNALPLGQTGSPLSVHLSTIIYRLRCDVWRTIFVPKLCLYGQTVSPYHANFKCPTLAGHFKSITDNLRRLNLPPDLSSLCRFRDDTGWGLAVDTATLIFTSGVAAHS